MQVRQSIHSLFLTKLILPFAILAQGYAAIAILILAIRQLQPVIGSSVIVKSLIVGMFLIFLALGYERGGQVDDTFFLKIRNQFVVVAIWASVGLSYLFINYFFDYIEKTLDAHLFGTLLLYLLLIVAPAAYYLGKTLPIAVNVLAEDEIPGAITGNVFGLSALGMFLGVLFIGFILLPYYGAAASVFSIFLVLMVLAVLLSTSVYSFIGTVIFGMLISVAVYYLNIIIENQKFSFTDAYANYSMLTHANAPELIPENGKALVTNAVYTYYTDQNHNVFPYVEVMEKIIYNDMQLRDSDILVLGAGGFNLSQGDAGLNHFTYVDNDSQIKKLVQPDFMPAIKHKLVIDDPRHYLQVQNKKYQVIVVDVSSNPSAIPDYLLTREFILAVRNHLNDNGGVALFNIIANPWFSDVYSKRVDNTIRGVFGSCSVTPMKYSNMLTHLIYACSGFIDVSDNQEYVDNMNTASIDSFVW